ncbi:MAG: hypothetical protein J6V90_02015 [Treponema sp.]|nr:hypothetical protein [Treponema sp.]
MIDSKDLDKYGVWVKNSPKDIKGEDFEMPENAIDDIDLPSDDDMFNDIEFPMTAEDLPKENKEDDQTEISDLDIDIDIPEATTEENIEDDNQDTTLSADELTNITGSMEGGADENEDTTLSPDELMNITSDMEGGADENEDTTLSTDELMNITENQDIPTEEASADAGMEDFNLDDLDITNDAAPASADEPAAESVSEPATEEISIDDIPDGEVDLDDFMSDSSSSAPSADSTPDGDVDLSAFMDGDDGEVDLGAFMDDAPSSKKEAKPEEIQDEKSLDIDVSFDDSASEFATEDNTQEEPAAPAETEKAPAGGEDMFAEFGDGAEIKKASASAVSDGNTEEIDLSDFGFDDDDSNIGMTNGPDSGAQPQAEVVDYDMKVSADDDSKTPSVQDVLSGNVDSSEDNDTEDFAAESAAAPAASPEISQKGQEILSQIMTELTSLKDEIKNLKTDFADLKDRPSPAAGTASIPAADNNSAKEEDTGFFGADDGDDTIALSGNELTNILSSAEFSTEDPTEQTFVVDNDNMEEPTIDTTEITPEDLAGTTDEFGEENVLPEEISVPKVDDDITVESSNSDLMDSVVNTDEMQPDMPQETLNSEAIDEIMQEDVSIADSLDDEKINYINQDLSMTDDSVVSVDDIVKENVSLQDDSDDVTIGVGDDINAAFEEADATESEIADTALAEKDAYETSVSEIMKENVSLQEDSDNVAVGIGDDINAAFEEADATESDITDSALAEKDAYENSKSMEEEFSLDIGKEDEEPVPETLDESLLRDSNDSEPAIDDTIIDESIFDDVPETSVDVPAQEAGAAATVAAAGAASEKTAISKDLKSEIVSVLSYMDQLLENLPEEKITEFAKSEHFVTYKKLFDELGLS